MKPIEIREDNIAPHIHIELEMQNYKSDWYLFEIRVSSGSIVDVVVREFIDYAKPKTE